MGKIPDDLRQIIADNIRKCRMRKFPGRGGGKRCAEAFNVSPQQWSPWERGMRTPGEERMEQLAEFFDVTVAYLREDHKQPPGDSFRAPPTEGGAPHDDSPPQFDGVGAVSRPDAPPQSGAEAALLLTGLLSTVSWNGIPVRLAAQDMERLGECIARAPARRGIEIAQH